MSPLNLEKVDTYPLASRPSKVTAADFAAPPTAGASLREFLNTLPNILAVRSLRVASSLLPAVQRIVSKETFKEQIVPVMICLAVLLVYVSFPTKNYYWDGIEFALRIERTSSLNVSLIHPNHLVYNLVGYLLYRLARDLGMQVRALEVLQTVNSFLSALCAYVLFHILKISLRSTYLAATLTLLFAFSATWWRFSTDANAYVSSILFLLISFYLLLPARQPQPMLLALTHSLAMCFHQLAVIFYPVVVLGLFLQTPSLTLRQRGLLALRYSGVAFTLTFGTFLLCFYLQAGAFDVRIFANWLTSYSPEIGFTFNARNNLVFTLRGHARLFFGGRFNFLSGLMTPPIRLLTITLGLLVLALLGALVRRGKGREPNLETSRQHLARFRPLLLPAATWWALYVVFLFFWIPQHTFYRMFYLPAIILLAGALLSSLRASDESPIRWRAALAVALIALSNFLFLIYPYARVRAETPLFLAGRMKHIWTPGTVIYYATPNTDNTLFEYFNPATTWKKLDSIETEEFENELREIYRRGGDAWMDSSAIVRLMRSDKGVRLLAEHTGGRPGYKLNDPAYSVHFVQIFQRDKASGGE